MSDNLADIWKIKRRGKRDCARHKELLKDAIKKNSKDIITRYDLITTDGDKKVKIPIRFLDHYRFKYGSKNDESSVGQGLSGKPGSKYRYSNKQGDKSAGPAGQGSEKHYYEDEVTIDEMVDILLEDLNLPWLQPNEKQEIESENEDQVFGANILRKSLEAPMRQMARNSGESEDLIINLVEGEADNHGYDFRNGKLINMLEGGIIDPAKVIRVALQNAVSVASTLITTNNAIVEVKDES